MHRIILLWFLQSRSIDFVRLICYDSSEIHEKSTRLFAGLQEGKMPEIRGLDLKALKKVYRQYIRKDFPRMELRPWFGMERAMKQGKYKAYGYYGKHHLLAYATFYFCKDHPYALLDYLAVVPGLRGRGVGSAFLKSILPKVSVKTGIFIEAESPDSTDNAEEKRIRKRRITFYEKNGASFTGVNCRLFGVDYNLLYYPGSGYLPEKDKFLPVIRSLYLDLYGPHSKRLCRPYQASCKTGPAVSA